MILLKAGYVNTDMITEPENQTYEQSPMIQSAQSIGYSEKYYIVQFTGPVQDTWKQNITSKGASIYNYIPNNAFVFRMNEEVKNQVYSMDHVKWIGEYKASYKYEPELISDENENTYNLLLFSSVDTERISYEIQSIGGVILSNSGNVLKVNIPIDKLDDIAAINGISWIEKYVQPRATNDVAAGIITVDTIHNTYGLNGSGQIVAVCDSGLDTGVNDSSMHADLRGRILSITDLSNDGSSADQIGHGTHVAGSVLGNGSLSGGNYSGMAPEAQLIFQAVGNDSNYLYLPGDLNEVFQPAYNLGARIHTNSWGGLPDGEYNILSQQVDQFMWEHPDMLILFSAGNAGKDLDSNGVIDNNSMISPGTAKNCLTVGASENYRPSMTDTYGSIWSSDLPVTPIKDDRVSDNSVGVAAFSSRGPTEDGRIKPDIVAPGTFIASTRSSMSNTSGWGIINENYLYMGGTSMSAPIVAGSAAIVREYYTDVENLSNPSAALLKATLLNGAYNMIPGQYGSEDYQEISGRPDYSQGWGRVDIENSIYPQNPKAIKYFDNPAHLNLSESWNLSYNVLCTSEPLRVTLVWTDYPGDAAVVPQLVNNLDLSVIGPDGTYYGNGAPDTVNNVEGVELLTPVTGTYTITVNATNVPQGPQNFSLVISYGHDGTDMYPEHNSYTTNSTTAVYMNLTHTDGIDPGTINMTIDGSNVIPSLDSITGGYKVGNQTLQPYSEGYHNVSVSALTNLSEELSYGWRFYASVEENVINIQGLEENSVIQDAEFDVNITSNKLCEFWYNVDNGNNSTNKTGFSFNATLNLNEGNHNLTVFAEDITGNMSLATVNFTVRTSTPVSVASTPSSGGGGGGGGGSTGEDLENIALKDVLSVYVGMDDIVDFDFDDEKNDIDYIRYQSLKNAGKISSTIEILKNRSTFADKPVSGLVYKNMNIWVGKTGYATETNIKNPVIGFRLSKEWIENNEVDPATIVLNRYNGDSWEMLDTKQNDPGDDYLYFEASTPGFSPFAITAEEPLKNNVEKTASTDILTKELADITTAPTEENENHASRNIPAISCLVTILILTIVCVFVSKQQN